LLLRKLQDKDSARSSMDRASAFVDKEPAVGNRTAAVDCTVTGNP